MNVRKYKDERVQQMRILMLGNSFTFYNDMPQILAGLTGAEVVAHTKGGAYLSEQLDSETDMGEKTLKALGEEKWDFVVLQEYSNGPILKKEEFNKSVDELCQLAKGAGAKVIFYATWAYQKDGDFLPEFTRDSMIGYEEMFLALHAAYYEAAERNHALIADVGRKFYELADSEALYAEDGKHSNLHGSEVAANVLAEVIAEASDL